MTAVVNGIQYIGGQTSPNEFINNQAPRLTVRKQLKVQF
jgi:hypothetical protein